jgi:energy-coupling factor transport system permease protein
MTLTVGYVDADTWVHRLDPRTKGLWMIAAGMVGFVVPHFGWIALNLALMVPFVLSARCFLRWLPMVALASVPVWFIAAINMLWGNTIVPSGHVPKEMALRWLYPMFTDEAEPFVLFSTRFLRWEILITTVSFEKGLYFAFRWINVVAPGLLFIYTTRPEDFASSLSQLRLPFTLTFMISTAVKFIPMICADARLIYDAQRSRGARIDCGFWPARLIRMACLFFPMLIASLNHAYNLSIGMEARAFHTGRGRTRFFEKHLDQRDKVGIAYSLMLFGAALWSRW